MLYPILLLLFQLAALVQLGFIWVLRYRKTFAGQQQAQQLPEVSVVICAKNEARNLEHFLPQVLQQDYPPALFEVVVVNDGSTDHSQAVLDTLQQQYPQLKVVTILPDAARHLPGKKYALAQGIAAARHDRLLLTDADCRPASGQWLRTMVTQAKDIVLGYGAYERQKSLLNRFIRWETAHTCMQYASYTAMSLPYMGVGRNLSYRKALLEATEQDAAFRQVYASTPSGDDDLLICRIAQQHNTGVCLDREAHTISLPETTWKDWWRQKTRHTSTGKYYPAPVKRMLGLYALSHSLYWFCGLLVFIRALSAEDGHTGSLWHGNGCLMEPAYGIIAGIGLFLLRLLWYWLNALRWYRKLDEKKLGLFYPLGDLGWALYNVFLSPYILWKNRKTWK